MRCRVPHSCEAGAWLSFRPMPILARTYFPLAGNAKTKSVEVGCGMRPLLSGHIRGTRFSVVEPPPVEKVTYCLPPTEKLTGGEEIRPPVLKDQSF